MMDFSEKPKFPGVNKESLRQAVTIDDKDLFGSRIVQTGSATTIRSIDIGLQVYVSDYMRAYVEKFHSYMFYDKCLHGCECSFGAKDCACPVDQPYIVEHFFEASHVSSGIQNGIRAKVQRWKALEILNDWNSSATQEAVSGKHPVRWVYFL